jgi:tetratricopeptide (TPR) repeat protein
MEWAISELDTLSSNLATGQNPTSFTAFSLTVLAADFLSGLGRREEGIMNLLEMEWLCHESNRQCFNGMLECAWMRARLRLGRDDSETEAAKAALLHCLALGEENKEKFEEGILEDVDSLIKRVKYSLGKVYLSTSEGDASDPIPLLMVAEQEDDEYFDKADTHYLLGAAHRKRHRLSGSVQDLKLGIDYLKSSFTISRAKDDTGTVFSRSNKVGKVLFNSREFGHSLEMFKEAAAFAKTVGSQNWEMEFWLNCGRVLLEEDKYEESCRVFHGKPRGCYANDG